MSKIIKEWTVDPESYSRYNDLKRMRSDLGDDFIESYERKKIAVSEDDKYFTVTADYENRLDLVSYKYYGTCMYWWVIAIASEISDPFAVTAGTLLRIPTFERAEAMV